MMSATTKIFSNSEISFVRFIQIVSLWEKSDLNPARLEQKTGIGAINLILIINYGATNLR